MQRIGLSALFSLTALLACQNHPAAQEGSPAPEAKPASPTSAPAATAGDAYTVRIVAGEAKAGEPATSVVEVTPGPGYHVNTEFPVRLKLVPPAGVTAAKAQLERADAELSEAALRFNVAFTAATAGTVNMAGTADFSVCNDNTCKLIRDEKLAWEVAVK